MTTPIDIAQAIFLGFAGIVAVLVIVGLVLFGVQLSIDIRHERRAKAYTVHIVRPLHPNSEEGR